MHNVYASNHPCVTATLIMRTTVVYPTWCDERGAHYLSGTCTCACGLLLKMTEILITNIQ